MCQFRYKIIFLSFYGVARLQDQPSLQGSRIHWENSQQNNTKQNQQKEKAHWANFRKNQPYVSKDPFPSGVTKAINSPGTSCDSTCEMVTTRGARQKLSIQYFHWGLTAQAGSAWHIPEFQTLRRKASIQHKLYCLNKHCRHSEPFLSIRVMGIFSKFLVLVVNQDPNFNQAFKG